MRYKLVSFIIIFLGIVGATIFMTHTSAITFDNSRQIDDAVFNNTGTMSAAQIDAFLNQFSGSCLSTNNGFKASEPVGYNPTNSFTYGSPVSAGQVIYDSAKVYGVNPQ